MNSVEIRDITKHRFDILGIKWFIDLPYIDIDTSIRKKNDVARRAVVLSALKSIAECPEDIKAIIKWLQKNDLRSSLTETERNILNSGYLTKQNEINFSWYQESLYAILWSLSIIDNMASPTKQSEVVKYLNFIPPINSFNNFLELIKLRSQDELIVELDFYYNLHWITKHVEDIDIPIEISKSVVIERRRALEWIFDLNSKWDNISLDT